MSKIFKVIINKQPRKFINKQSKAQQVRLLDAIYKLPNGDTKHMKGGESFEYRLRVGDYRVLYELHDNIITIIVTEVGNRGDIYK